MLKFPAWMQSQASELEISLEGKEISLGLLGFSEQIGESKWAFEVTLPDGNIKTFKNIYYKGEEDNLKSGIMVAIVTLDYQQRYLLYNSYVNTLEQQRPLFLFYQSITSAEKIQPEEEVNFYLAMQSLLKQQLLDMLVTLEADRRKILATKQLL